MSATASSASPRRAWANRAASAASSGRRPASSAASRSSPGSAVSSIRLRRRYPAASRWSRWSSPSGSSWSSTRRSKTRSTEGCSSRSPGTTTSPAALPAAVVAACRLRRVERGEQPFGEGAGCRVEGLAHFRPDVGGAEHVPLSAHVLRGQAAGVGDAPLAGVRGGRAACIDESDLPDLAVLVGLEQLVERLARAASRGQQREPARPVPAFGERLRRHRAHARLGPGARGAGVEGARLDGHAQLAGLGVAPDDRVRHDAR